MSHSNVGVQLDGIKGMKELLGKFPGVLELNMASLLGKLSELVSVQDPLVWRFSLKLLEHIICPLQLKGLCHFPHFSMLSCHAV